MHEFELIKKYFSKLTNKSKSSLKLNDDVFFDKKKKLVVSVDTYNEGVHFPNFKYPYLVIKMTSVLPPRYKDKVFNSTVSVSLILSVVSLYWYFL